jgi:hypothetical protein
MLKTVLDVAVEKLRINEQEKNFSSQSCLALSSSKALNRTTLKLCSNRNSNNVETINKIAIRNGMELKSSSTTDWSQLRDRQNIIINSYSNLSNKQE